MPDFDTSKKNKDLNPFLTDRADELWNRLDTKGKRVSKEELLKRAEDLRDKTKK